LTPVPVNSTQSQIIPSTINYQSNTNTFVQQPSTVQPQSFNGQSNQNFLTPVPVNSTQSQIIPSTINYQSNTNTVVQQPNIVQPLNNNQYV